MGSQRDKQDIEAIFILQGPKIPFVSVLNKVSENLFLGSPSPKPGATGNCLPGLLLTRGLQGK